MEFNKDQFEADAQSYGDEYYLARGSETKMRMGRFHEAIQILLDDYDLIDQDISEQILSDNADQGIDYFHIFGGADMKIYVVQVKDHENLNLSEQKAAVSKMVDEIRLLSRTKRAKPNWDDRRRDRHNKIRANINEEFQLYFVLLLTGKSVGRVDKDSFDPEKFEENEHLLVLDVAALVELEKRNRRPNQTNLNLPIDAGRCLIIEDPESPRLLITVANALDYVEATREAGTNIFRLNPRLYLDTTSPTNKRMLETLRSDERKQFHFLNNGITVVCKHFEKIDNEVMVSDFQVVNGCQTTETLWKFSRDSADQDDIIQVSVPIRLIEIGDDESLAARISETTNSQTAVSSSDLVANDPCQKRIKEEIQLAEPKFFYEARRGEWRKATAVEKEEFRIKPGQWTNEIIQTRRTVKLKELAQVIMCITKSPSNAKEQISSLFNDRSEDSDYIKFFETSWTDAVELKLAIETYLYVSSIQLWRPTEMSEDEAKNYINMAKLGRFYLTYLVFRQWRKDFGISFTPDESEPTLLPSDISRAIMAAFIERIADLPRHATRALLHVKDHYDLETRNLLRQKSHRSKIEEEFDRRVQISREH